MPVISRQRAWAVPVIVSLVAHAGLFGLLVLLGRADGSALQDRRIAASRLPGAQLPEAQLVVHVNDSMVLWAGSSRAMADERISANQGSAHEASGKRIATDAVQTPVSTPKAAQAAPQPVQAPAPAPVPEEANADVGPVHEPVEQIPPESEHDRVKPLLPAAGIAQAPDIPAEIRTTADPLGRFRADFDQSGDTPGGMAGAGRSGSAGGSALAANLDIYAQSVRSRVDSHKRYPARARRRSLQGTATITLVIAPDGQLTSTPRLTRSSGVAALDREAMRMAQAAAPFAPSGAHAPVTIEIPVQFSVSE